MQHRDRCNVQVTRTEERGGLESLQEKRRAREKCEWQQYTPRLHESILWKGAKLAKLAKSVCSLLVRHKCSRPVDLINDASRAVMPVMLYLVE